MKYHEIIETIDNKNYQSVYFLSGDEYYYIDKISNYASTKILTEQEKSFNQVILYGKETNVKEIIEKQNNIHLALIIELSL